MKLYIKYMVSMRCKLLVKQELDLLGIQYKEVELGMVEIRENISNETREDLKRNLKKWGLELLDDSRSILVDRIKSVITEMIHHTGELPATNYSDFINSKIGLDYTYISNVFSEVKGVTIQQFIILNKIEKVKELLLYDELTLTEIAHQLHYSSVAHLSNQFKKITGLTPTFNKQIKEKRSGNLEDL